MKYFDMSRERFITNEVEESICLYLMGLIYFDYLMPEAKEVYLTLPQNTIEEIKKRLDIL